MDDQAKNHILLQFQEYLESVDLPEDEGSEQTDLFTLFGEMAALRNEVKIESRQFKTALEEFKSVFDLLRASHGALEKELEKSRNELQTQRKEITRSMLLEYIDIYDRLSAGLTVLGNYRPVFSLFGNTPQQDKFFIKGVQDGQTMTLRRIEQILAKYQVQPIDALHNPVNPHWMVVVEVDNRPNVASGIVTEELRKGFLWGEEILRLAEVKVNKQ